MIKVWDLAVRVIHWGVALLVFTEYFNEDSRFWHRNLGYAAAILVLTRLAWGAFTGSYAHYRYWWPSPSRVGAYLCAIRAGRMPRMLGLNPPGAVIALLLWTLVLALGITGWMMGTDAFWGEEWLENLHENMAWALLGCVLIHLAIVLATSLMQRENLPKAMLTGRKRSGNRHG